jgi:hypothetical protein
LSYYRKSLSAKLIFKKYVEKMQVKYLKKCSGNANEIGQLNEAFGHPRLNPRERKDHPSSSPLTQTSSEKCNEDFV